MYTWKKITAMAIAMGVLGTSAFAQKEKASKSKTNEKHQEIIIRKSGDKNEKMTIVVDGDKVTINGKPVEDLKDSDVTVLRNTDVHAFAPSVRALTLPHGGANAFGEFERLVPTRGNKAMLGVVTEVADGGAKITELTKESGAEKAGLQKQDVITKIGDKKIENSNDLIAAIGNHKPKDKVEITYKRNGKEAKTTATLGENQTRVYSSFNNNGSFDFPGNIEGFGFSRKPKVGMQIMDVEEGTGVQVRDVDEESAAAKAGLKEGDIISEVNGNKVAGVDAMREQIKDIKEGDVLKMTFRRGDNTQTVDVKIPKKLKTANL